MDTRREIRNKRRGTKIRWNFFRRRRMVDIVKQIDVCGIDDCPAKTCCPNAGESIIDVQMCNHPEECQYSKRAILKIELEK